MIIKLREYNKVRELLIMIETTGLWGHVCYQDTGLGGICNYSGCLQGEEGERHVNMTHGHIQSVSKLGMREGTHATAVEQSKEHQSIIWNR